MKDDNNVLNRIAGALERIANYLEQNSLGTIRPDNSVDVEDIETEDNSQLQIITYYISRL